MNLLFTSDLTGSNQNCLGRTSLNHSSGPVRLITVGPTVTLQPVLSTPRATLFFLHPGINKWSHNSKAAGLSSYILGSWSVIVPSPFPHWLTAHWQRSLNEIPDWIKFIVNVSLGFSRLKDHQKKPLLASDSLVCLDVFLYLSFCCLHVSFRYRRHWVVEITSWKCVTKFLNEQEATSARP